MKFQIKDIVEATGGRLISGDPGLTCDGVSTDTRTISEGGLFLAIKGVRYDAHEFLDKAISNGAACLLVDRGNRVPTGTAVIEVADTERALGDIAAWWRSKFQIPRVGITGSNGKSTTKEMVAAIASSLGKVLKTEGNFNNLIGLPHTIFRLEREFDVAILEMGMNAPGEIKRLAEIADPTIGLITNATAAHLEKLHTVEAVANAKGELFEAMRSDGIAVINQEDKLVKQLARLHSGKKITFGMQNDCDVRFMHMETEDLDTIDLKFAAYGKEYLVHLPVPGAHNVMNALAAIGVGLALGIEVDAMISRLEKFKPMSMRFERIQLANGVRLVNDSYNANPESMRAAFQTVGMAKRAGRFIAVLGDMFELGDSSKDLHRKLGEDAARMGVERLYIAGEHASFVASGAKASGMDSSAINVFDDVDALGPAVEMDILAGDVLLIKGSRGMRMERVTDHLKRRIGMG